MKIKNKLILAGLLIASCNQLVLAEVTDVIEKSYDFDKGGTISLSNVNGNVTISACDCSQVQLTANISASDQQTRDRITVKIKASDSQLSIKTKYAKQQRGSHDRNNHSEVVYTLSVPNSVNLNEIELVNGDLKISGVTGQFNAELVNGELISDGMTSSTDVSMVNGDMELSFDNLNNAKKIKLNSVNGDIVVNLPSDANVKVSAETVSGKISNDFGLQINRGRYVGSDMSGTIGDGSVRLSMENVNGKIKLKNL